MISENITKSQFIVQVLERDINNIYRAQLLIARKNVYIRGKDLKTTKRRGTLIGEKSGALLESLENPIYKIQMQGSKLTVTASIVKQLRFMDMKHLGNWKIYNRQVWGILYNNSLKEIKYGYGQQFHDLIGEALQQAFSQHNLK